MQFILKTMITLQDLSGLRCDGDRGARDRDTIAYGFTPFPPTITPFPHFFVVESYHGIVPWKVSTELCRGNFPQNFAVETFHAVDFDGIPSLRGLRGFRHLCFSSAEFHPSPQIPVPCNPGVYLCTRLWAAAMPCGVCEKSPVITSSTSPRCNSRPQSVKHPSLLIQHH